MANYRGDTVEPMPWIGLYAAAASLICTLSMAADVFHGLRGKKFWFPCKFFSLNAMTLSLLAVAMKLSLDLNTDMEGNIDQLSKLSGTVFISTVMGNCLSSLGTMDNQEILMNVVALIILVITAIINISIEIRTNVADNNLGIEYSLATIFMFVMLLVLVSSALSLPTTKKDIEAKYQDMHQRALDEEQDEKGKFTTNNLKSVIRTYWVMASTGNPQFVMVRSATCTTCGAICLLSALTLGEATIRKIYDLYFYDCQGWSHSYSDCKWSHSDYQWSTIFILVVQSIGIAVGTVAPTLRWFTAVNFKCSEKGSKSCENELKIETYWTQRLEDWQQSSFSSHIRGIKCRKLLHKTKFGLLSLCIKLQIIIVRVSKIIQLFSVCLLRLFLLFLSRISIFKMEPELESSASTDQEGQEPKPDHKLSLSHYVLLLEGEVGLPKRTLKKIFCEVDQLILTGKKEQPKNLIELLEKSSFFNGVADFHSEQVPSLHSEEPPNCWTLPVATLTSIAIAIPSIQTDKVDRLLRSVSEGLRYANLEEKCQTTRRDFVNIRNAADVVWVGVELYHKWLDEDINNLVGNSSKEILEELAKIAERSLMEFKTNMSGNLMDNPIQWPVKVIAANSLYRISTTLLQEYEGGNDPTDEELFEKLSVMLADIFAACLTSLPHIIIMKCHCDAIEKRERSVRQAALLLGESQKILEILQQHNLSSINPDQAAHIDRLRVLVKQKNHPASNSTSTNEATHKKADAVIEMEA